MNNKPSTTSGSPEERRSRRTPWIVGFALVLVVLGYGAMLLIGGEALRNLPGADQVQSLRRLVDVEAPRALPPPISEPQEGVIFSPSPVLASPKPTLSPSIKPPPPGAPPVATFTIEFENTTGVRLTGVKITSKIPDGTTFKEAGAPGGFNGEQVVWNLGVLDPGQKGEVFLRVLVLRKGLITNRAVISSNEAPQEEVVSTIRVS